MNPRQLSKKQGSPGEKKRRLLRIHVSFSVQLLYNPMDAHYFLRRYLEELVEGGRLDETATLLRCLGRLSSKADNEKGSQGAKGVSSGVDKGGAGWVTGYNAVLAAVQELVRKRTGGATLALLC